MRTKTLVLALVIAVAGLGSAPAFAGHWHGRGWFGWGFGIGPVGFGIGPAWWGADWGEPAWYEPAYVAPARTDLTAVGTDVEPEYARVILNGELIGVADDFDGSPGYLYLEPGHYTLEFTLQGYGSENVEVDAAPGRYVPVKLKLARVPGEKAAPWYDRPKGLPVSRVFGPPPATATVTAMPGPDPGLRPGLRGRDATGARPGEAVGGAALELRVTPANAAVYLDGRLVGTADELGRLERGLAVAPGRHRIEVAAPGHASRSVDVDVTEGQRQQVVVELDEGTGQS